MKIKTPQLILSFIIFLGFILRLISSITHTYSSDELSAINRLSFSSFSDLLEFGVKTGDMHPAGVQIFLKFWSNIVGTDELWYRLPFVLLGTASIYLVYLLGRRLHQQTGLIAAGIWSTLLFPVLQSELARPYSPGLFFVLLSAVLFNKLLFDSPLSSKKWLLSIGLGFSFALGMYTHYFAFLAIAFIGLSGLLFVKKRTLIPYLMSGAIAIILFLPHLSITLYHTSIEGGLQWLPPPTYRWLFDFLFFAFNSSWLVIIVLIILIVIAFLKKRSNDFGKFHFLFLMWFFGIYILAYILSISSTPILKFPVMLFPLPFLIIIIAFMIGGILTQKKLILPILITVFIGLSTVLERNMLSNLHFEVFKELVDPILSWQNKLGKSNIIKVMNVSHPNYINFYAKRQNQTIDLDIDLLNYEDDERLKSMLNQSQTEYCIIGYSGRLTPPYFFTTSLAYYPYIIAYKKYSNSAVFLLSKTPKKEQVKLEKLLIADFPNQKDDWAFSASEMDLTTNTYHTNKSLIYGPEIKLKIKPEYISNQSFLNLEIEAEIDGESAITIAISPQHANHEPVNNFNGEPIWIGRDLEKMIRESGKAYFSFSVPAQLKIDDYLKIYLWHRKGNPIKIKRIKLFAIKNIWN